MLLAFIALLHVNYISSIILQLAFFHLKILALGFGHADAQNSHSFFFFFNSCGISFVMWINLSFFYVNEHLGYFITIIIIILAKSNGNLVSVFPWLGEKVSLG